MGEFVIREDKNGAATLFLNRPEKLNALNVDLFSQLEAHIDAIARQIDTVGLVIVRGAGRCFSAGNDLSDISAGKGPPRANFQGGIIEKLANLPQPVISAVHGHCYTGGLELALAGDLIFASANAKFGDTHGKWSMAPVWGMSQRLPRRVGTYKAREMMFTSKTYSGAEAAAMGLANFCVPDEAFDAELDALAATILANSWFSHRANKKLLVDTDGLSLGEGLAHEVFRGQGRGPDMEERIAGGFGSKAKA